MSIAANAAIPEQLVSYVEAVSGMKPCLCGNCLLYTLDGYGVLVAWQNGSALRGEELEKTVELALATSGLRHLTVLADQVPESAPPTARVQRDRWWRVDLPSRTPSGKLANMLRRAESELRVESTFGAQAWSGEHQRMVEEFCEQRKSFLDEGSRYIFTRMDNYLSVSDKVLLFSARNSEGRLQACSIGDFSSFSTAFYMFAYRSGNATPGAADLVLSALMHEAEKRGMSFINMGLGIKNGIEFFKKKWGAEAVSEHVETAWKLERKGFFRRLFGG